jgi:hypothetical protein
VKYVTVDVQKGVDTGDPLLYISGVDKKQACDRHRVLSRSNWLYAAAKMRREPWPAKFHGNLLNKQDRIYTWTPYQYGVDYASKECIK